MTDIEIIALYWTRNEDAIRETDLVYGKKLHGLAQKIVQTLKMRRNALVIPI